MFKVKNMLSGYYANVSGMNYNSEKLEVISNNLSNANTTAFRRSLSVVRSRQENSGTKWIENDAGKRLPDISGIQRTGIFKIYKDTGTLQETGNSMDVAIPSELKNAFFSVNRSDPNDRGIYYTRNGTLGFGLLDPRNPDSPNVLYLGGHIALDEARQPIEIDPVNGSLNIGIDGMVQQGNTPIGELPIYRFNKSPDPNSILDANLQQLSQRGDSLYKVPEKLRNEFHPSRIEIGKNGASRLIIQGVREGSNVNPITELVEMMEATKSYSSNANAIGQQVESLTKLFQMVRS